MPNFSKPYRSPAFFSFQIQKYRRRRCIYSLSLSFLVTNGNWPPIQNNTTLHTTREMASYKEEEVFVGKRFGLWKSCWRLVQMNSAFLCLVLNLGLFFKVVRHWTKTYVGAITLVSSLRHKKQWKKFLFFQKHFFVFVVEVGLSAQIIHSSRPKTEKLLTVRNVPILCIV